MKNIKIWVDTDKPRSEGWIHVKDFRSFQNLLHTVRLPAIDAISFGTHLDDDEDNVFMELPLDAKDCATELISVARGAELPHCINHTKNPELQETINKYVDSYGHKNYCAYIV